MIELTGTGLTLEQFDAVVHEQEPCEVSGQAREGEKRSTVSTRASATWPEYGSPKIRFASSRNVW